MNRLYYSPGSCSLVAHIILEEIGQAYELKLIPLPDGVQHTPDYLQANPRARVPVLNADGFIVTEIVAVLTYLARTNPSAGLLPLNDPQEEGRCLEWLAWLSSSVHVAFAQIFRPERYVVSAADFFVVKAQGHVNLRACFVDINNRINGSGYALRSGYSIVDPFLLVCFRRGNLLQHAMTTHYPAWASLVDRLMRRPAVQRAMDQEKITLSS